MSNAHDDGDAAESFATIFEELAPGCATDPFGFDLLDGVRIDGFFAAHLLHPGAGEITRATGAPQFCGSMACRLFSYTEAPHSRSADRISRCFAGEFLGITRDGSEIGAMGGYLPPALDSAMKREIDRGGIAEFAGDVWCEPVEEAPLGYRFVVYDRRPRDDAQVAAEIARHGPEWAQVVAERRARRQANDRRRKAAARKHPETREQERKRDVRRRQNPRRQERERHREQQRQRTRPLRPFLAVDGEGAGKDKSGR